MSTGSCRGWRTTGCCARGTWSTASSGSGWSTRSTSGSSGSTCGWPTTPGSVSAETQLMLLRQVAEAVAYAHGNRVVHRGLTPHAVWVHRPADGDPRVLVGDWRSAGTVAGPGADRAVRQRGDRPDGRVRRGRPGERGDAAGGGGRGPAAGRGVPGTRGRLEPGRRTGSGSTCSRSARWPTTSWRATRRRPTARRCASGCTGTTGSTWRRTCRRCRRRCARWCWRPPGRR